MYNNDPVEDARMFTSRGEMPWYQSNDINWKIARDAWLRTQPDCGEYEDWNKIPDEEGDMCIVNIYYNPAVKGENTNGLIYLCRTCHDKHYPEAPWAQRGGDDASCEICRTSNNQLSMEGAGSNLVK